MLAPGATSDVNLCAAHAPVRRKASPATDSPSRVRSRLALEGHTPDALSVEQESLDAS